MFNTPSKVYILQSILNSANKTINTINEIKPIYNDIKPLIIKGSNLLQKKEPKKSQKNTTTPNNPQFFL